MRIDAHQHFWKYDPVRDNWITEDMNEIRRDFFPSDLQQHLKKHQLDGCVTVQADQSEDQNHFLLELAQDHDFIKGIVGWIDLRAENLQERLDFFSRYSLIKGYRHVIQGEPEGFMLDTRLQRGITALGKSGLTYDILIFEHQLQEAIELVKALPEMPLVIDHIAKPDIKKQSYDDWKSGMTTLAEFPHLMVKVSGMITEADWKNWTYEQLRPYLEVVLDLFGPDRLMYGSDWPVCQIAGSYDQVIDIVDTFIQSLSSSEQEKIMGHNAIRFYKL